MEQHSLIFSRALLVLDMYYQNLEQISFQYEIFTWWIRYTVEIFLAITITKWPTGYDQHCEMPFELQSKDVIILNTPIRDHKHFWECPAGLFLSLVLVIHSYKEELGGACCLYLRGGHNWKPWQKELYRYVLVYMWAEKRMRYFTRNWLLIQ